MSRPVVYSSRNTPDAVLESLRAAARTWRQRDIPEYLHPYGALGYEVSVKGSRFTLAVEIPWRGRPPMGKIVCTGEVLATRDGSVIRAVMRTQRYVLSGILLVTLAGTLQYALTGEMKLLTMLPLWTVLSGGMYLLVRVTMGDRMEAEARALESLLRRAAEGEPARSSREQLPG